ncbi:MAG: hypothetical protein JSS40_05625 [Proteobacteria bacterium]|nr:hypothetical protein [Pseudomonadota bacterium]
MSNDYETLRWPTNLDRDAIVARLVQIREAARTGGLDELVAFFRDVEEMVAARIGASVIGAINWIEGKPELRDFGVQLSMVAMNLKNLK